MKTVRYTAPTVLSRGPDRFLTCLIAGERVEVPQVAGALSLLKVRIDRAKAADRKRIADRTKDATKILASLHATLRTFRECIGADAFAEFRKDNKTIIEAVRLVTLHKDPAS